MPLPVPKNNEKKSDFMSRCVTSLTEKEEFNDNKQRVAVCMNIFSDSESKASVVTGEGEDKKLFFSEAANENKTLNKPFRTPKGPKKFSVYVKNQKETSLKLILEIQTWRSKETIQKEERRLEIDIVAIQLKIKQLLDIGHVKCGG